MPRQITSATSLDNLRKEAKRWLKALRDGDAEARARFERAYAPSGPAEAGRHVHAAPAKPGLRDVQHALAREHGRDSWIALTQAVEKPQHDRLTEDMLLAFNGHDEQALQRLNDHYKRLFSFEDLWAEIWRRVYSFRQRAFRGTDKSLRLDEAQTVVAQDAGYGSWKAMTEAAATGAPPVPPFTIDEAESAIGPARMLNPTEWDAVIAALKERRLNAFHANGMLTDTLLARIAEIDHVTSLTLGA